MTRKSRREIEREIQTLEPDHEDPFAAYGWYIFGTNRWYDTPEEAPRPDLVVPQEAGSGYKTAAPSVLPDGYDAPIIFLSEPVVETWPGDTGEGSVPVSELWDNLTDEQLRQEYATRQERGEPIPPVLENYEAE